MPDLRVGLRGRGPAHAGGVRLPDGPERWAELGRMRGYRDVPRHGGGTALEERGFGLTDVARWGRYRQYMDAKIYWLARLLDGTTWILTSGDRSKEEAKLLRKLGASQAGQRCAARAHTRAAASKPFPGARHGAFAALAAAFEVGDVVFDEARPNELGIVREVDMRSCTIAWAHGGTSGGPGLLPCLRHREPRLRLEVPRGAHAVRGWNREQAVRAALRRAGLCEGTRHMRGRRQASG
jgi:hypothetical protein